MLTPNPSLASVIFWQWANQSLNVAVNFSNSNRLVPMSVKEIGVAYASATTAAVGISVGLGQSLRHFNRVSPSTKALLARFVPFVAVSTASVVNVAAMRYKELQTGVPVFALNEDGSREQVGTSAVAGRRAVGMTALSRIFINSEPSS